MSIYGHTTEQVGLSVFVLIISDLVFGIHFYIIIIHILHYIKDITGNSEHRLS